jgi:hypothetical protein
LRNSPPKTFSSHSIETNSHQDEKLKEALLMDEKSRWKRIGGMVGKTEFGCKKRAKEMKLTI